jgi:hypothetical protein
LDGWVLVVDEEVRFCKGADFRKLRGRFMRRLIGLAPRIKSCLSRIKFRCLCRRHICGNWRMKNVRTDMIHPIQTALRIQQQASNPQDHKDKTSNNPQQKQSKRQTNSPPTFNLTAQRSQTPPSILSKNEKYPPFYHITNTDELVRFTRSGTPHNPRQSPFPPSNTPLWSPTNLLRNDTLINPSLRPPFRMGPLTRPPLRIIISIRSRKGPLRYPNRRQ